ncbi:MAG: endolytic transglycosylase MltG [Acetobacteraceae bacterium]
MLVTPAPEVSRPSRRRRIALILVGLALLAGGGIAAGYVGLRQRLAQAGPLDHPLAVVVPHGDTAVVGQALRAAGAIDSDRLFRLAAWLTRRDGKLHAAELAFPAHASLREVLAVLRTAKPVEHRLTIPEGLTAVQIAALVQHAEAATGAVAPPPEGSVLPQTYSYEYGTPRGVLLARGEAAMDQALAAAWAGRAADLPLANMQDALILASIVERETALPEERPHVAAVYLNRLHLGMRLDADPTVAYAASGGAGVLDHKLTRGDLEQDDPFNTYRRTGLPPTPIDSPGMASIRAVLHPAESDDLYFVADGTGGHIFARTLEAQNRNVARSRGR